MISIRMARGGRKNAPTFTIVAANSRSARDGSFLQKLGYYNPKQTPMLSQVKVDAMKEWIEKGAQVSSTVLTLMKKQGIKL